MTCLVASDGKSMHVTLSFSFTVHLKVAWPVQACAFGIDAMK